MGGGEALRLSSDSSECDANLLEFDFGGGRS